MIKKKKFFLLSLLFFMILSSVVFAGYSEEQMSARPTAVGTDSAGNSVEGVAPGNPVLCMPTTSGPVSTEGFVTSDGTYYPPGTSMISVNENGNTGNVREGQSVTIGESYLNGTNDDTVTFHTLAEPVIMNEDASPDNLYQNPTWQLGIYDDTIMTEQAWVDSVNANEYLPDGVTVENYDETMGAYVAMESIMRLMGDEFTTVKVYESEWDPVRQVMVIKGVDKSGIVGVIGMGTNDSDIVGFNNTNRLFTVRGDGVVEFESWPADPDDPSDDPDDPDDDDDGGGDPGGKGGKWSDYGAASVSANVWSDQYDVSTAIPTSENVNGSMSASDMSWYYNVITMNDAVAYSISGVTISWDPYLTRDAQGYEVWNSQTQSYDFVFTGWGPWYTAYRHSEVITATGVYSTHYFGVQRAEMNKLGGGSLSNQAVGTIASVGAANIGGNIDRSGGIVFDLGRMNKSSFSTASETRAGAVASAEAIVSARIKRASYVKNDVLNIKSAVLGGQTEYGEEFKGTPYDAPSFLASPSTGTISNSGVKMIPSNKPNGAYQSSASASYPMVPGFDGVGKYSRGASAPQVFVWTPVVNRATITPEAFINQKVVKESGLTYLQLDKKFVISIPDSGTHISARGYGTRNYNSYQAVPRSITNWGKIKDVKVPFDAYLQPSNTLIKAGTWLSDYGLATAQNSYTFLIPVWSEENKGEIETRVVAENVPIYMNGSSCNAGLVQDGANLSYTRYIAEKKIPVEIVGKIYDLRISGTNDPGWPGIKGKEGPYVTAQEFPFGQAGQNSQKQYRFAPKLGYMVEFDFKTKGVKTDNVDVSVQPEGFYFISKNGGEAQEVDLFFKTVTNQYIKIDPSTNNSDIIVNLSNKFMRVVVQEIIDSRRIMIDQVGVTYTYNQNVPIGQLPALKMPEKLRLCYNNFAEYVNNLYGKSQAAIEADANGRLSYSTGKYDQVNNGKDTVIASVGHWYAGYRLPSSTIAVPKGTTANQILRNPDIAKENGYILVKFDIVGKNGDEDYLRYTGPESITEPGTYTKDEDGKEQKWQDPQTGDPDPTSPKQDIELPNGKPGIVPDGSVILFETDLKANNDYEVIGTH